MLLAPRDHGVLDRALLQMIEHLIAGDFSLARHRVQVVEIVAALKRRNRTLGVAAVEIPGALPDDGNLRPAVAELFSLHVRLVRLLQVMANNRQSFGRSLVGWAKARSDVPTIYRRHSTKMVGTLALCPPYGPDCTVSNSS